MNDSLLFQWYSCTIAIPWRMQHINANTSSHWPGLYPEWSLCGCGNLVQSIHGDDTLIKWGPSKQMVYISYPTSNQNVDINETQHVCWIQIIITPMILICSRIFSDIMLVQYSYCHWLLWQECEKSPKLAYWYKLLFISRGDIFLSTHAIAHPRRRSIIKFTIGPSFNFRHGWTVCSIVL